MDKKHTAILIDSKTGMVTTSALSFSDAQAWVGGYLEPVQLDDEHTLLVDEEGLLKGLRYGFTLDGREFVGRGVVFGDGGENFTDCKLVLSAFVARVMIVR